MTKHNFSLMVLSLVMPFSMARAESRSLADFLERAWGQSPLKQGIPLKNEESEQRIASARGKYFPHVSLEAIDSTGFPGSSSALQVGGFMGSPFRSGVAGGVVVEQTVYDFGRIAAALSRARAAQGVDEAGLADEKLKFLSTLGRLYLSCARTVAVQRLNESLLKTALLVQRETGKFTKTGQRSIVDNELVRIEVDDLNLQQKQLQELEKSLSEQMASYTQNPVECEELLSADSDSTKISVDLKVRPPQILLAQARRQEFASLYKDARAQQLPLLNLLGSAGDMNAARLVEKQDYALGVGLVFPIWNGGEDVHREQSLKSQMQYQDEIIKAVLIDYQTWLKNLQDTRARDQDVLDLLGQHVLQIRRTMDLATKRFFQLQGTLVDVRDTLTRLRSIENDKIQTEYSLAYTTLQLALLDTHF